MRVLVTGHGGFIGRFVAAELRATGHQVSGFDLADGNDIRDYGAVVDAVDGCDSVVHLAGVPRDGLASDADVYSTNVHGTINVLRAAAQNGRRRVVFASSVNVFGVFMGRGTPDYLPVDDDHPCRPRSPYSLAKYLAEEACAVATRTDGLETLCLRIPHVLAPGQGRTFLQRWSENPASEWQPYWEYGAYIDVRDLARAIGAGLAAPIDGHQRVSVSADDAASSVPPQELAARVLPTVPWRSSDTRGSGAPGLDNTRAKLLLTWEPRYAFTSRGTRRSVRERLATRLGSG
jgi:nucleoside-diphosphate-sugar epimerase